MKIVEGRYYKTRDGRKVGPMVRERDWFLDQRGFSYHYDGFRLAHGNTDENDDDLISEWTSTDEHGPIREVRRREIVPGVYGAFKIYTPLGNDIAVGFSNPNSSGNAEMTAEQLREAAHLFVQLAEVLEESQ